MRNSSPLTHVQEFIMGDDSTLHQCNGYPHYADHSTTCHGSKINGLNRDHVYYSLDQKQDVGVEYISIDSARSYVMLVSGSFQKKGRPNHVVLN